MYVLTLDILGSSRNGLNFCSNERASSNCLIKGSSTSGIGSGSIPVMLLYYWTTVTPQDSPGAF